MTARSFRLLCILIGASVLVGFDVAPRRRMALVVGANDGGATWSSGEAPSLGSWNERGFRVGVVPHATWFITEQLWVSAAIGPALQIPPGGFVYVSGSGGLSLGLRL